MKEKIIIVGAGLCGTLLGLRLAQRGYRVRIYEKRPDPRRAGDYGGRSINLALSDRGLQALAMAGMIEKIKPLCIPMRGRMLHAEDGALRFSPYSGRAEDYINSISRSELNVALLNAADEFDDVQIYFDQACKEADLEQGKIWLEDLEGGDVYEKSADIVLGTDGAGSIVRRSMMKHSGRLRFNFSQSFLTHGYKELVIPAAEDGGYRIEKNALHIWPRGSYMLIALPNLDGSFTVTLFLPYEGDPGFDDINTDQEIRAFFKTHFADAVEHMPSLVQDYHENPTATLGTIRCSPWTAYGTTLLLGDAAHAIVPFYGQGMNASFEDVYVLDQLMDQYNEDWSKILKTFSEERKIDADAIADLAIDNFHEMQDHVARPDFIAKRKLEMQMEQQIPAFYSKYGLVTFREDLSYHEAMAQGRAQDKWLLKAVTDNPDLSPDEAFKSLDEEVLN